VWANVAQYKARLEAKSGETRAAAAAAMLAVNAQRCAALPVFGADLTALIRAIRRPSEVVVEESEDASRFWDHSSTLRNLVLTVEDRVYGRGGRDGSQAAKKGRPQFDAAGQEITSLHDMLTQYVCMIPKARAVSPTVSLSGLAGGGNIALPISAAELASQEKLRDMRGVFSGFQDLCRPAYIRQQLSFPDKRLLQYDCGKLQVMDQMFHKFRAEGHRVLLFTQMSKVLDVIEEFLSFHGFTYVRLDGSTKVEHRQMLVERFNQDPKIFCFISSTRSGGVGINLTGADTVVFYDSDWNPAMDRQAQDRCHRIGQTREVHIYRLVSESTVEENILKKANQKRHLESLALQDGASSLFDPEMFKKVDVRDLFDDGKRKPQEQSVKPVKVISDKEWEAATANVEDEQDVAALKEAHREEKEEMADFQEEGAEGDKDGSEGGDAVDDITSELLDVEKYALFFLEEEFRVAGISLVEKVDFEKEALEKQKQMKSIRTQEERTFDEDEIQLFETSGCAQQG